MTIPFTLSDQRKYDDIDRHLTRYARNASSGLSESFSTTNVSCSASEIAFIDRIVVGGQTNDNGYTVNGALSGASVTELVVNETIDTNWVPQTGTLTVQRVDGTFTEIAYSAYATSTFTITETAFDSNGVNDDATVFINSGNMTITLKINGRDCPFHLTATPDGARGKKFEMNPRGNLVLQPSQTLSAKSNDAGNGGTVAIYYRKYPLAKARELGLLTPSIPNVASTGPHDMVLATTLDGAAEVACVVTTTIPSWVPQTGTIRVTLDDDATTDIAYTAWSGSTFTITETDFTALSDVATAGVAVIGPITVAGTTRAIIPAVTGHHIEVLGFYVTGHCYDADAHSLVMGFWDASGNFVTVEATTAATAHMICVAHAQGLRDIHRPEIVVDNTDGCIQGPAGYGLYIEATSALAGDPSFMDAVVMYRYVKQETVRHTVTLSTALDGGTETSVVSTQPIPLDTPATGTVHIATDYGLTRSIAYTSWSGSTFTIASSNFLNAASTVATTALTGAAVTSVEVAAIAAGTPQTGKIRITLDSGATRDVRYTSWDTVTYTIISTDFTADNASTGNAVTTLIQASVGNDISFDREGGEVNDYTGSLAQTMKRRKKFWVSTMAAPTTYSNVATDATNKWFTIATTAEDSVAKVKGYVGSFKSREKQAAASNFESISDMCLGLLAANAATITLGGALPLSGASQGSTALTSSSVVEVDTMIPTNISLNPAFRCYERSSGNVTARFQIAWGEFTPYRNTTGFNTLIA